MTYALVLLTALAVFGWAVFGGAPPPDLDRGGIRAGVTRAYVDLKARTTALIRDTAKNQLHKAVDSTFEE